MSTSTLHISLHFSCNIQCQELCPQCQWKAQECEWHHLVQWCTATVSLIGLLHQKALARRKRNQPSSFLEIVPSGQHQRPKDPRQGFSHIGSLPVRVLICMTLLYWCDHFFRPYFCDGFRPFLHLFKGSGDVWQDEIFFKSTLEIAQKGLFCAAGNKNFDWNFFRSNCDVWQPQKVLFFKAICDA